MNRSTPKRIGIIVVGLIIGLVGLAAWSLEQDAGGGWNAGYIEPGPGDMYSVHEFDENYQGGTEEPATFVVFTGTADEARAYVDSRSQAKNFVVPGVIIAVGVILVIVALIPSRKNTEQTIGPRT
jgi:hypothetical protein